MLEPKRGESRFDVRLLDVEFFIRESIVCECEIGQHSHSVYARLACPDFLVAADRFGCRIEGRSFKMHNQPGRLFIILNIDTDRNK